uniref:Uncharacterized protein n=2 Tax=Trichuris muris TaxID=70415 RepID=A0A5S6R5X5_TRIMR
MASSDAKKDGERKGESSIPLQNDDACKKRHKASATSANIQSTSKGVEKSGTIPEGNEKNKSSAKRKSLLDIAKRLSFPAIKSLADKFSQASNAAPTKTSAEMAKDHPAKQRRRTQSATTSCKRTSAVQAGAGASAAKPEKTLGELAKQKNLNADQMRAFSKVKRNKANGQPIVKVPPDLLKDRTDEKRLSFDTQLSSLGWSILNLLETLTASESESPQNVRVRTADLDDEFATKNQWATVNVGNCPACTNATAAAEIPAQRDKLQTIHSADCPLASKKDNKAATSLQTASSSSAKLLIPSPGDTLHGNKGQQNRADTDARKKDEASLHRLSTAKVATSDTANNQPRIGTDKAIA